MERNYFKRRLSTYLLPLFAIVLGSSCTIYQNVPDEDGIYSSETRQPVVIQGNTKEFREHDKEYFTKELERIDRINGTDILTDIDNYSSYNDTIPDDIDTLVEPTNRAWGYNDGDAVVVNINVNNGGFGWGNWNLYDPYFSYGFYNPWIGPGYGYGWGSGRWGFGAWGWGRWGRPFNNPYYNPFGPYHPFYHGLAGYRSNRFNRYGYGNPNFNYGRRGLAYNTTLNGRRSTVSRRNYTLSDRRGNSTTSRRRTSTYRNSNTTNSSTRRRATSNTRRDSNSNSRRTINSTNSTRRNTRSTRSSSSSSSRSRSSTSRSSSRSSSSSRGSSSRGSSSRRGG